YEESDYSQKKEPAHPDTWPGGILHAHRLSLESVLAGANLNRPALVREKQTFVKQHKSRDLGPPLDEGAKVNSKICELTVLPLISRSAPIDDESALQPEAVLIVVKGAD